MFCKVYVANREGCRRPAEQIRAGPVQGELHLRLRSRYGAILADPYSGKYVLPVLDQVMIDIQRGGFLLTGTEIVPRRSNSKSACDHWPQMWWCVPTIRPGPPSEVRRPRREIEKMARAMGKMQ